MGEDDLGHWKLLPPCILPVTYSGIMVYDWRVLLWRKFIICLNFRKMCVFLQSWEGLSNWTPYLPFLSPPARSAFSNRLMLLRMSDVMSSCGHRFPIALQVLWRRSLQVTGLWLSQSAQSPILASHTMTGRFSWVEGMTDVFSLSWLKLPLLAPSSSVSDNPCSNSSRGLGKLFCFTCLCIASVYHFRTLILRRV